MVQEEINIGKFRLSLTRHELRFEGTLVPLSSRAIDILCELAAAEGEVVSKDDLMARVWHGVIVGENNIQVHISALRRTLEKNGDGQSWIVTVPGRGYRLMPPAEPSRAARPACEASAPVTDTPSLAVLAFHNLSDDPEQEHFADGIVDEIITALSHIRWLFVASRNSTFAYKARNVDARQIAREIAVRYVVEGSVRKSDGQVRITAQLIDAESGTRMWADRFDGPPGDVFNLQDRVASCVAGAIEPVLLAAEAVRSAERPTTNLTAYDHYVRAHAVVSSSARQIPEALGLLDRAFTRNQRYGPALACAAYCYYRLILDGRSDDPAVDRQKSIEFARRALEVGRDDPGTLAYSAQVLAYFGEDINAMMALIDRALGLNPNFVRGWHTSADIRLNAGQLDLAIAHIETALRLNPGSQAGTSHTLLGAAHFLARRFDEAVPKLLLAIQEDPSSPVPYRYLAACYAHMDRPDEAREIVRRLASVGSIAVPDARYLRNIEHRELFLCGLRLALGTGDRIEISPSSGPADDSMPHPRRGDERRQVTVLCCELIGNAPYSDGAGLEDLSEAAEDFQHCVSEAANHHQGFVYRDLGNSALILFGYPDAHEHDAEQAVRAGLQLCASIRTLPAGASSNLRCRVGIATGMVAIAHPVKTDATVRRESIVGGPVTLAVRLASLAQSDGVAIGSTTRRLIGDLFECSTLGALDVSDNDQPARVWKVLEQSAVASRFIALRGPVLTPLVGRDEVIDLLLRRWARTKMGDGQTVLISGEPGIGKSRVAMELVSRLSDEPHVCLRYFCSPYHQDSALFPFIDQLAHAAGFTREDSPAVRSSKLATLLAREASSMEDVALLADLLALPTAEGYPLPNLSPQQKKARILEALIHQLESLARKQPALVIFEDAHWIDPTSRELLDTTLDCIRSLPVLLIVTLRPELQLPWTGQEQVSTLVLNRLDRHDRTVLAEQISGGKALPGELVVDIAQRSDGVPLFVEELTKSILESGLLREEGDRYVLNRAPPRFAIPTTLHGSLMTRLDHLASARQVAQIGAAIGRTFNYALLRAVCALSEPDLHTALEQLAVSQLVRQRGTPPDAVFTFKHALVQDAAHASLSRNIRRQLHAQIAKALESLYPDTIDREPELLALHYAEAGLVEKSIGYWVKAGQHSFARSAMVEAAAQFNKGLDQLTLLPNGFERQQRELELLSGLGAALTVVKGFAAPETGDVYAGARMLWEELGCPSEFLHIPFGQSEYYINRGEFPAAQSAAADLLRLSRERNDACGVVLGHYAHGRNLMLVGKFTSSRSHLEEALSLYHPTSDGALAHQTGFHPHVKVGAHLGVVLLCLGYPDQGLARCNAAITAARRLHHPPSLALSLALGCRFLALVGDNAALRELAAELADVTAEHGISVYSAGGTMWLGWLKVADGAVTEGISLLRSGAAALHATQTEAWRPSQVATLATAYEVAGQIEQALILLDDALQIVQTTGECWILPELNRLKGQLLVRQGHTEVAEELYGKALCIAARQEAKLLELRAATSLARLRRDQGRAAEAHSLLAPVYGWFTEGFATPDLKAAKILLDDLAVTLDRRCVATAPAYSSSSNAPGSRQRESGLQQVVRNRFGEQ